MQIFKPNKTQITWIPESLCRRAKRTHVIRLHECFPAANTAARRHFEFISSIFFRCLLNSFNWLCIHIYTFWCDIFRLLGSSSFCSVSADDAASAAAAFLWLLVIFLSPFFFLSGSDCLNIWIMHQMGLGQVFWCYLFTFIFLLLTSHARNSLGNIVYACARIHIVSSLSVGSLIRSFCMVATKYGTEQLTVVVHNGKGYESLTWFYSVLALWFTLANRFCCSSFCILSALLHVGFFSLRHH